MAPYKAQTYMYKVALHKKGVAIRKHLRNTQLRTIDDFQGSEAAAVLLDLVVTDCAGFVCELLIMENSFTYILEQDVVEMEPVSFLITIPVIAVCQDPRAWEDMIISLSINCLARSPALVVLSHNQHCCEDSSRLLHIWTSASTRDI